MKSNKTLMLESQLEIEKLRMENAHLKFELSKANMLLAEHAGMMHRTRIQQLSKEIADSMPKGKKNA